MRDDWQNHRDFARDDWQNWFDDHYWWHGGWHWGYAGGYWNRWDHLWDRYPVAAVAGLTWWGANALSYSFGYDDYYNPYYVETPVYNYSEPIISVNVEPATQTVVLPGTEAPVALPANIPQEGVSKFDEARVAFYEGKYDTALKLTDEAVAKMPRDAVLHEFRSLVLFAIKRYKESAAAIHAVLDVGPGWDWKTMSGLYPDAEIYTQQLRALEAARNENLKVPELHFLAAYHYLTCGFSDQALVEFKKTLELQPQDQVTAALVANLSPRDAQPAVAAANPAPKPVPPDQVVGNWTAGGKGTAKYTMNLAKDGSFTWAFSRGSRKEQVKGAYTVEGNVLAMEPDSGGTMLAELNVKDGENLHFQMVGGGDKDPGLNFQRAKQP